MITNVEGEKGERRRKITVQKQKKLKEEKEKIQKLSRRHLSWKKSSLPHTFSPHCCRYEICCS